MNDEDRILEDIKEILKELDEQGRMKYTQRYMQRDTDFTVLSMQDVRFKMQKMILN